MGVSDLWESLKHGSDCFNKLYSRFLYELGWISKDSYGELPANIFQIPNSGECKFNTTKSWRTALTTTTTTPATTTRSPTTTQDYYANLAKNWDNIERDTYTRLCKDGSISLVSWYSKHVCAPFSSFFFSVSSIPQSVINLWRKSRKFFRKNRLRLEWIKFYGYTLTLAAILRFSKVRTFATQRKEWKQTTYFFSHCRFG